MPHRHPQVSAAPPQHLTERDAAFYLSMSRAWLRVRRRRGGGPAWLRLGHSVRYSRRDLDAFLASKRVTI